jgi:murein L,D-transpeptidase YcbB/YkuD
MNTRWAAFVAFALWLGGCSGSGVGAAHVSASSTGATAQDAPETLTGQSTAELNAAITSGRLPDLQWPNFSDRREAVQGFYTTGNNRLGWIRSGKPTPQALELIGLLETADRKGLDPNDYDGSRWQGRVAGLEKDARESSLLRFDLALTVSAVRYLRDLHLGRVSPTTLHKDFDPDRKKHNAGVFLWENVTQAPSVKEALVNVEPPFPGYQRALAALQEYMALAKKEVPDPLVQVQKPIEPGKSYSDEAKLVRRLQFLGDLSATTIVPEESQTYSGEVAEAVKRFQARHGLEAAGKLGPQTIVELNRPMSDRVEQLRMTLERWRWVPHEFPEPPIVVNIPEFVLRAYAQAPGKAALMMPVVVGKAMRTQTPVMEEDMKYLIFWPYWNVPPSILRNEIVPKIAKDPDYLAKNAFEVATYGGQVVTDGTVSEDVLAQLKAGKLMVRQKPGPKNALGLIKFIFPNDNNVYLHSTPSQAAFSQTRRDFSHGCIRVEDPQALAVWVLRNNPGWTKDKVEEAFKAEKEQQVNLTRMIPVLIVYGTAVVKEDGRAYFFDDIYGYDKQLAKLTGAAYSSRN